MKYHMHMNISTLINMLWGSRESRKQARDLLNIPTHGEGSRTSGSIRAELQELLDTGQTAIPFEGCDNWQPLGICKGHVQRGVKAKELHA